MSLRGPSPKQSPLVERASSLSIGMTGKMPVPPKMRLLRRLTPRNDNIGRLHPKMKLVRHNSPKSVKSAERRKQPTGSKKRRDLLQQKETPAFLVADYTYISSGENRENSNLLAGKAVERLPEPIPACP